MADELMSAIDYTPTTDVVRHALTFPRLRLGEPRHMTREAFERWVETVRLEERERIAQDIKADRENVPTLVLTTKGQQAAWQIGMARAFMIARGATR